MGLPTKKGTKGEAVEYFSRKQALRRLQVGLPSFNRLCLFKGIYPSQPHCRKIAGRGDTTPKIYFKRKDINLLLHEPVLAKLREIRVHQIKIKKAKQKGDKDRLFRLMKSKPKYTLHHLVKEIYPTKEDALSNIDDALKNVFIFSVLPKMTQFNSAYIGLCKKLKLEFLNYCITMQSLRKCFISVKGYYMEADILGHPVRWAMPHQHTATILPGHVDYRLLSNQVEFDCTMLACLLKNLYTTAGLAYPPKFVSKDELELTDSDMLASLTCPVVKSQNDHNEKVIQLSKFKDMDENVAAALEKEERVFAIQTLFKDKKVYLSREVPREVFSFLIRCCGGDVSWDKVVGHGATFSETDDDINYHVIDRPLVGGHVSIFYIQPQYICDSINAGRLLPVKDYMPGNELPAHLSPFVDYSEGYVPPEYRYLKGECSAEDLYEVTEDTEEAVEEIIYESENESEEESEDEDDDMNLEEIKEIIDQPKKDPIKRKSKQEFTKEINERKLIKMKEMDIPKKQRNLYNKMKHAEKKKVSDVVKMTKKREVINKKRQSATKGGDIKKRRLSATRK